MVGLQLSALSLYPLATTGGRSEVVTLRVFVDHALVEAQLDGRTMITAGFFPAAPLNATGVELFAGVGGAAVAVASVEVWGMGSIWVG